MYSGDYPGSQAGVADMFAYDQDQQDWYPAGYWAVEPARPDRREHVVRQLQRQRADLQHVPERPGLHRVADQRPDGRQAGVPETMRFNGNGYYNGGGNSSNASCATASSPTCGWPHPAASPTASTSPAHPAPACPATSTSPRPVAGRPGPPRPSPSPPGSRPSPTRRRLEHPPAHLRLTPAGGGPRPRQARPNIKPPQFLIQGGKLMKHLAIPSTRRAHRCRARRRRSLVTVGVTLSGPAAAAATTGPNAAYQPPGARIRVWRGRPRRFRRTGRLPARWAGGERGVADVRADR